MEDSKKKNRLIPKSEIFWIVFEGLSCFVGLFLMILGIVGDYLNVKYSENWILLSQSGFMETTHSQITFRWLGFFFIIGAVIVALITLNHYAKRTDLDEERASRRAQRLQVLSESAPEAPKAPATEVKEVASTPVEKK